MAPSTVQKLKNAITGNEAQEDESIFTEFSEATSLSYTTRMWGFIICFLLGIILSVLGTIMLWRNLKAFAVLYTFGNISSLASTCFLMGPCRQLRNMFKEKRIIATILVLVFLALTLCAAFWWNSKGLALVFCVCQYLAMTWYCLSYIPFARDAVKEMCTSCMA